MVRLEAGMAIAIKTMVRTATLAVSCLLMATAADARSQYHASGHHSLSRHFYHAGHRYAFAGGHVIQCVAFARSNTDIALSGNADDWWQNAEGVYARGTAPEV